MSGGLCLVLFYVLFCFLGEGVLLSFFGGRGGNIFLFIRSSKKLFWEVGDFFLMAFFWAVGDHFFYINLDGFKKGVYRISASYVVWKYYKLCCSSVGGGMVVGWQWCGGKTPTFWSLQLCVG